MVDACHGRVSYQEQLRDTKADIPSKPGVRRPVTKYDVVEYWFLLYLVFPVARSTTASRPILMVNQLRIYMVLTCDTPQDHNRLGLCCDVRLPIVPPKLQGSMPPK